MKWFGHATTNSIRTTAAAVGILRVVWWAVVGSDRETKCTKHDVTFRWFLVDCGLSLIANTGAGGGCGFNTVAGVCRVCSVMHMWMGWGCVLHALYN